MNRNSKPGLGLKYLAIALPLALAAGLQVSGGMALWAMSPSQQPQQRSPFLTPPKIPEPSELAPYFLKATPLTVPRYWSHYGQYEKVRQRLMICLALGLPLPLLLASAPLWPAARPLYGDARWATLAEIEKAGLFAKTGLIAGRIGKRYLVVDGQVSMMLNAAPRQGKGEGIITPNLLFFDGSVVVNDIRGENYEKTAGYRAQCGHQVFLFDPLSFHQRSHRWNPFFYVPPIPADGTAQEIAVATANRIDAIQRISSMFFPRPVRETPFWAVSARDLFVGVALYLFETEGAVRTIGEVLRHGMAQDDESFGTHWKKVIEQRRKEGTRLSPLCERLLFELASLAPQTVSGIRKEFTSTLTLWHNPLVDAATSGNDFDFRKLRSERVSVYVKVNPDSIEQLQPMLALFFEQAIGLNTRSMPKPGFDPNLPFKVLFALDEFTALRYIPAVKEGAAHLAGYNLLLMVVVQSDSQLVDVYGREGAATLRNTTALRIIFPPKEYEEAKALSDELGSYTEKINAYSYSLGKTTRTPTLRSRPLMFPEELQRMGSAWHLVHFKEPGKPVPLDREALRWLKAHRIYRWNDRVFGRRYADPPQAPKLTIVLPQPLDKPAANTREIRMSDAETLDTMPASRFAVPPEKYALPFEPPETQAEANAAIEAFQEYLATQNA
ncbi:MAG: type IV secretory system conjugative DNA transfer family protein [Burkholderiales bacterium]